MKRLVVHAQCDPRYVEGDTLHVDTSATLVGQHFDEIEMDMTQAQQFAESRIEIYKHGSLLCICASKDWRTFLPGVPDWAFRWRKDVPHAKYTWLWLFDLPR